MKPVQKASMGQGHLVICAALSLWAGRGQLGGAWAGLKTPKSDAEGDGFWSRGNVN